MSLMAVLMIWGWADRCDDCPIDRHDVKRVDRTFDQRLLKQCEDEGAENAPRWPDNEKNEDKEPKGERGTIERQIRYPELQPKAFSGF